MAMQALEEDGALPGREEATSHAWNRKLTFLLAAYGDETFRFLEI